MRKKIARVGIRFSIATIVITIVATVVTTVITTVVTENHMPTHTMIFFSCRMRDVRQ